MLFFNLFLIDYRKGFRNITFHCCGVGGWGFVFFCPCQWKGLFLDQGFYLIHKEVDIGFQVVTFGVYSDFIRYIFVHYGFRGCHQA